MSDLKTTALNSTHRRMGAKMVDFGGYEMPVSYGSQIEEHQAVRTHCGLFDVSHMGVVDAVGAEAEPFLRKALANDVARLRNPGAGQYSLLLNDAAGVIDDLIVYRLASDHFRLVVNCANKDSDLQWLKSVADGFDVQVDARPRFGILALQGPASAATLAALQPPSWAGAGELKRFHMLELEDCFVARTGYTGEDGFEIICADSRIEGLWSDLGAAGAVAAGLGARDTLRLEAGYCLWGHEMDAATSPLEANLAWTLQMKDPQRDFIGRAALQAQMERGVQQQLRGLVLEGKGVMRDGCVVQTAAGDGIVTSGSYSPTLQCSIALARLPLAAETGSRVQVVVRGRALDARVTKPAFVSNGKSLIGDPVA